MTKAKRYVTIKGVKDGLVFVLNDTCEFSLLIEELVHKLDKTHQQILAGPEVRVLVKLGKRRIEEAEKDQIKAIIGRQGNLHVHAFEEAEPASYLAEIAAAGVIVKQGVVRSGQTVEHKGNLLFVGDVHPGGMIVCTGDIFVMGALRGMAHAGVDGNEAAVIAAAFLRPTQLRIAGVISRPPDEWGLDDASMEFAYIREGKMEIEKITYFHRIRPQQ